MDENLYGDATAVQHEIETFAGWAASTSSHVTFEALSAFAVALRPKDREPLRPKDGKRFALTLMGITHGNETAGVAVLNRLAAWLACGRVRLASEVALVLGNVPAARAGRRFLERDLNRVFAKDAPRAAEEHRARALEPLLAASSLFIDLHQTLRAAPHPFFIFPYRAPSLALARAVLPWAPIVTHWGQPFSAEGRCSDEFVNAAGGVGISLELGRCGLDPAQIAVGLEAVTSALEVAERTLGGASLEEQARTARRLRPPPLFTWAAVVPWPSGGIVTLDPGLDNFRAVDVGERLGTADDRIVTAPVAGRILFPKYLSREQQIAERAAEARGEPVARPTELCRLLRDIADGDLPQTTP
jgi:succinylglutamate desuccinylase